ncbi:hypothetical protein N7474_005430 [Penicillium riverlandense]|uniref:uncharacterized protein n=1 Tax=Penicillium riverlandense TaxID=1903569 RepID=UPI00254829AE|nr:uncharacterized protein N7474_005430 [Penicillium riverlandense]KAJ5819839.1 hypothetical protein N7474_005430 [Penicillium riverlandense]
MSSSYFIASEEITHLQVATLSGNIEAINAVLSRWRESSIDNETFEVTTGPVLYEAIVNNSFEVVSCLLDNQVPMNSQLFMKATEDTSYQILQEFLNHGWDINTPISSNDPPALANSFHDANLTKWFLAHGADPNRRCERYKDYTPLSIAFRQANFTIIQILLNHGASLLQGQVMHYAAMRELDDRLEVLNYLLEQGLPLNDIMYQSCEEEYLCNMYSGIGTPLHYAAGRGLPDSVKLLIARGASPHIKDPASYTAADWAEINGQTAVSEFLRPMSTDNDLASIPQFTDGHGRHFTLVPMDQFIMESGFRLV